MKHGRRWAAVLTLAPALFFLLLINAWAQEGTNPPPPPADQEGQQPKTNAQGADGNQTPDTNQMETPTPAFPVDTQIHPAGKAPSWMGPVDSLHYGPLYLGNIDLIGVYDQFYPTTDPQVQDTRFGILRADIVFSESFKKSLLVLDCTPQLAVLNGQVRGGANGAQAFSIGQDFDISPRFSIAVKDTFGYTQTRQIFPDQFLLVDRENGGIAQSYFIENSGTHLDNTVAVVVNYKLTPRLLLSVASSYIYSDTHYIQGTYIVDDSQNTVSLTYAKSPRTNIGILQSVEFLHPIRPVTFNNSFFRMTDFFYSEQLSRTWWITGKLGVEAAAYAGFAGTTWGATGSFETLKTFSHSDLAFAYNRASTLMTFATERQTEQSDINYTYFLQRRLKWTNGVGYFHQLGGDPRISAKYAISTLEYHLAGGFSFLTSYSRRSQASSTTDLISGNRNTFLVGIRWAPTVPPGH
ncbi:MAG TPA: hypothetical protein VJY15_26220 [Candidatus Acidoferrum sp.]|nr:hypothetical protein [Candidatus Acidoferrum sp.]